MILFLKYLYVFFFCLFVCLFFLHLSNVLLLNETHWTDNSTGPTVQRYFYFWVAWAAHEWKAIVLVYLSKYSNVQSLPEVEKNFEVGAEV